MDVSHRDMMVISANLGFLWTDLPLPNAIRAAGDAGFDAVECHMPYDTPADEVRLALSETGLSMVSLNTRTGDHPDDFGVAALPGRQQLAKQYIDEAIEYAAAIDCRAVSIVAGKSGRTTEAETVYRSNLAYAAERAAGDGIGVLIEPLNTDVAADYHLVSADAGVETIAAVGASNLKLMVDCFHISVMDGALKPVFERVVDHIGHVQFASIPDRSEPDRGSTDYAQLLPWIAGLGYDGAFGAEYNPATTVEAGLGWLDTVRQQEPTREQQ